MGLAEEQKRIARVAWAPIAGFVVVASLPFIYVDLYQWSALGPTLCAAVFIWILTYGFFVTLMQRAGYLVGGKATGIGTYFTLNVVSSIAIGLGLVLLVLPGVYLLMRWLPSYARALTTEAALGNTLGWSWKATAPVQKPRALALVGPVLCYALSMTFFYSYELGIKLSFEVVSIASNLAMNIAAAWYTVLGIAAFGVLSKPGWAAPASRSA